MLNFTLLTPLDGRVTLLHNFTPQTGKWVTALLLDSPSPRQNHGGQAGEIHGGNLGNIPPRVAA